MIKLSRITTIIAAALIAIASFSSCQSKQIVIVSTNDVHASFELMPKMITLVDQLRAENDHVLVLDGGDRWTGNPYIDKAEYQGEPLIKLMNRVGYDYGAMGNHEFDYNQQVLADRMADAEFQLLCANADFTGTPVEEFVKPYEIFDIAGVRMAIVSFIQLNSAGIPSAMPTLVEGVTFRDGVEAAKEYRFLRDSADVVVALTHLGYTTDSVMVCREEYFDLVVGGHSHTHIPNGEIINGTLVTQTGGNMEGVGITRIKLKGNKIKSITNEVISLDDIKANVNATTYVESCIVSSSMNSIAGGFEKTLDEIGLINMFGDVMREYTNADVALQNIGSIRVDSISRGRVSVATVYSLEPFNNHIVWQEMTTAQMRDMIINIYGNEPASYIDLNPSGMNYTLCIDNNFKIVDIKFTDLNGKPLSETKKYRVASSNYVSVAYEFEGQGEIFTDHKMLAEALCDAVKSARIYVGDNTPRATIQKVQ